MDCWGCAGSVKVDLFRVSRLSKAWQGDAIQGRQGPKISQSGLFGAGKKSQLVLGTAHYI